MEFSHQYSQKFGSKTTFYNFSDSDPLEKNNFYHPYAFIGIPGLPPGKGYE